MALKYEEPWEIVFQTWQKYQQHMDCKAKANNKTKQDHTCHTVQRKQKEQKKHTKDKRPYGYIHTDLNERISEKEWKQIRDIKRNGNTQIGRKFAAPMDGWMDGWMDGCMQR